MKEKSKFALYLPKELRTELEHRYREDGSCSQTAFTERALRFYLDYLSAGNAGEFLPAAVKSCMEGRLGMLENRMASLLFKLTVALDMNVGILSDAYEFSEESLRQRRAESVKQVKQTNGLLSLEQRARASGEV